MISRTRIQEHQMGFVRLQLSKCSLRRLGIRALRNIPSDQHQYPERGVMCVNHLHDWSHSLRIL